VPAARAGCQEPIAIRARVRSSQIMERLFADEPNGIVALALPLIALPGELFTVGSENHYPRAFSVRIRCS
jgi:hypothetical protein